MEQPKPKRLYEVWKGSNKFLCGGRLIFGPDVTSLFLTILLIAGPTIAFICQTFVKISHHTSAVNHGGTDEHSRILGFPVLVVAVVILAADLCFLFATSTRDPGIVPRLARPPEPDEVFDATTTSMEWIHGRTPHVRLPRTKDVHVNGYTVKVKFCDTCFLYRPLRTSHCSICDNCVQKFDHHCPWVGQCIGLRNYRFFYLFISSSTFLCIFIFTVSWLNIIQEKKYHGNSIWKSMKGEILSLVLIVYTFVSVWFVGGLTVFHFYLISTNQTTYENFRYRYDKNANPYSKGFLKNFMEVFFSKIPPSMIDLRSFATEDSIETGDVQNIPVNTLGTKAKVVDIEMGSRRSYGGNTTVPRILQDLDYGSVDGDLKQKDGGDKNISDRFSFHVIQPPLSQGHFDQKNIESYHQHFEEAVDDGRSSNGGTSALLDHHIHSKQT